jgi:hypothetical protein
MTPAEFLRSFISGLGDEGTSAPDGMQQAADELDRLQSELDVLARVVKRDLHEVYVESSTAAFKVVRLQRIPEDMWLLSAYKWDDSNGEAVLNIHGMEFPTLRAAVDVIPWSTQAHKEEADAVDKALKEAIEVTP